MVLYKKISKLPGDVYTTNVLVLLDKKTKSKMLFFIRSLKRPSKTSELTWETEELAKCKGNSDLKLMSTKLIKRLLDTNIINDKGQYEWKKPLETKKDSTPVGEPQVNPAGESPSKKPPIVIKDKDTDSVNKPIGYFDDFIEDKDLAKQPLPADKDKKDAKTVGSALLGLNAGKKPADPPIDNIKVDNAREDKTAPTGNSKDGGLVGKALLKAAENKNTGTAPIAPTPAGKVDEKGAEGNNQTKIDEKKNEVTTNPPVEAKKKDAGILGKALIEAAEKKKNEEKKADAKQEEKKPEPQVEDKKIDPPAIVNDNKADPLDDYFGEKPDNNPHDNKNEDDALKDYLGEDDGKLVPPNVRPAESTPPEEPVLKPNHTISNSGVAFRKDIGNGYFWEIKATDDQEELMLYLCRKEGDKEEWKDFHPTEHLKSVPLAEGEGEKILSKFKAVIEDDHEAIVHLEEEGDGLEGVGEEESKYHTVVERMEGRPGVVQVCLVKKDGGDQVDGIYIDSPYDYNAKGRENDINRDKYLDVYTWDECTARLQVRPGVEGPGDGQWCRNKDFAREGDKTTMKALEGEPQGVEAVDTQAKKPDPAMAPVDNPEDDFKDLLNESKYLLQVERYDKDRDLAQVYLIRKSDHEQVDGIFIPCKYDENAKGRENDDNYEKLLQFYEKDEATATIRLKKDVEDPSKGGSFRNPDYADKDGFAADDFMKGLEGDGGDILGGDVDPQAKKPDPAMAPVDNPEDDFKDLLNESKYLLQVERYDKDRDLAQVYLIRKSDHEQVDGIFIPCKYDENAKGRENDEKYERLLEFYEKDETTARILLRKDVEDPSKGTSYRNPDYLKPGENANPAANTGTQPTPQPTEPVKPAPEPTPKPADPKPSVDQPSSPTAKSPPVSTLADICTLMQARSLSWMDIFYQVDSDRSESISVVEAHTYLKSIGVDKMVAMQILRDIDSDKDAVISKREWMQFGNTRLPKDVNKNVAMREGDVHSLMFEYMRDNKKSWADVFRGAPKLPTGTGMVGEVQEVASVTELMTVLTTQVGLNKASSKVLLQKIDSDMDGCINIDEWNAYFQPNQINDAEIRALVIPPSTAPANDNAAMFTKMISKVNEDMRILGVETSPKNDLKMESLFLPTENVVAMPEGDYVVYVESDMDTLMAVAQSYFDKDGTLAQMNRLAQDCPLPEKVEPLEAPWEIPSSNLFLNFESRREPVKRASKIVQNIESLSAGDNFENEFGPLETERSGSKPLDLELSDRPSRLAASPANPPSTTGVSRRR
jgi:hypothetical protein